MPGMKKCPKCGLVNPATAQRCDCGWDFASATQARSYLGPKLSDERAAEIQRDLKGLNVQSFVLAFIGFALQAAARGLPVGIGALVGLVGTGFFIGGLASYARMRGLHPAYSLLGLLSCIGFLVLYTLPKNCLNCRTSHSYRTKQCTRCGVPLSP